jgi:hypothetical protein
MSFEIFWGSGFEAPHETRSIAFTSNGVLPMVSMTLSAAVPVQNLPPGVCTFTARYKAGAGIAMYSNRYLTVIPLP